MQFGEIISKAWKITWRFRYLWVLAIFAGVTGPGGGGGGGNFPSGSSGSNSSSSSMGRDLESFFTHADRWIPVVMVIAAVWIIFVIAWTVLRVAARGGLIWAVDAIEEGYTVRLGPAWSAGISRFWSMFGVSVLVGIPMLLLVLAIIAGIVIPLVAAFGKSGEFSPSAIAPMCGTLVVGVPALIVLGFLLGAVEVLAHRCVMIEGRPAFDALRAAWHMLRARLKDTLLMWLISWGLSMVAGIALAIPLVILTLALGVPAILAAVGKNWGLAIGMGGIALLIIIVVSVLFNGIWGTFTSSLWTIFFRRLVGREVVATVPASFTAGPGYAPGYYAPTPAPTPPAGPPVAPAMGSPYAPPMAEPYTPPMAPPPASPGPEQAPDA